MKNKKIMSLFLALAMVLSLAVPAFATDNAVVETDSITEAAKLGNGKTTMKMTYQAPVIALTVPKNVSAVFNPYKIKVTTNDKTALINDEVTDEIVSADNLLISRSSVGLQIKAAATGKLTGTVTDETKALKLSKTDLVLTGNDASTKKEAMLVLAFGSLDTSTIDSKTKVEKFMEPTYVEASGVISKQPYEGVSKTDLTYPAAADLTAVKLTYVDDKTAMDGIVVSTDAGKETLLKSELAQCKVVQTGTGNDGTPTYEYRSVSAVPFKLTGNLVPNPKDNDWSTNDKVEVSIAWKFVPKQQEQPIEVPTYIVGTSANASVDLTTVLADANATPAFDLKTSISGVTLSTTGALAITNAALAAQKGSALAAGDAIDFELKVSYKNNATTSVEVTRTLAVKVEIVDQEIALNYSVGTPADVTSTSAVTGIDDAWALVGAPNGITVGADGKVSATKQAMVALFGGTAPTAAGKVAYSEAIKCTGTNSNAATNKWIVVKVTSAN